MPPPRKRKVMVSPPPSTRNLCFPFQTHVYASQPLGDSSNRIRPRTPDARVERTADKPALLKSTTAIVKNDDITRATLDSAFVNSASPDEVKSDEYKPSPPRLLASIAIDAPSPINPTREANRLAGTTPPRPLHQPPTVVETCPTPPSSSTATTPSRRVRRRPLLDERADGHIVSEEAVLSSSSSSSSTSPLLEVGTAGPFEKWEEPISMAAAAAAGANADVARKGSLDLPAGSSKTDPSFAPRPRQTPRPSMETTTLTPPLSDMGPADLLSALLSQSLPVSEPRRNSDDMPRSAATSLRSGRPRTNYSCSGRPESATPWARAGLSTPRLENRSRPVSPRSPPLRPQPSTTTLFSWDLAHLPAPDALREKPYRVSWTSVLLPTRYLGGGRGSGRYGDQWGPVERKKKVPFVARSSLPGVEGARFRPVKGDESARSNRRWSGRKSSSSSVAVVATAAGASLPAPRCSPTSGRLAVDSSASLASESLASREPERTPSEEETRQRPQSIRQRLRRSSVASWAAGSSNSTTARKPATVSRRQSLVASLFGAKSTASERSGEEEENLHQWVSVVLR